MSYNEAEAIAMFKLIDKHIFAKAALDKNSDKFVVYIVVLEALSTPLSGSFASCPIIR